MCGSHDAEGSVIVSTSLNLALRDMCHGFEAAKVRTASSNKLKKGAV
jgi:hypothetical protein